MKYILTLIICLLTFYSCDKVCSSDASEKLSQWEVNKPDHYAYTIKRSSYTTLEYLGPYRVEILNDELDTIYFDLEEYLGTVDNLFEGWDNFEKIKTFALDIRIEEIFESIITNTQECDVSYNESYFFPSVFKIHSEPDIPDSGSSLSIVKFEILN